MKTRTTTPLLREKEHRKKPIDREQRLCAYPGHEQVLGGRVLDVRHGRSSGQQFQKNDAQAVDVTLHRQLAGCPVIRCWTNTGTLVILDFPQGNSHLIRLVLTRFPKPLVFGCLGNVSKREGKGQLISTMMIEQFLLMAFQGLTGIAAKPSS